MIDIQQLLPISIGSGIASIVPCGSKEVVVSYMEMRSSVAWGDIQDK